MCSGSRERQAIDRRGKRRDRRKRWLSHQAKCSEQVSGWPQKEKRTGKSTGHSERCDSGSAMACSGEAQGHNILAATTLTNENAGVNGREGWKRNRCAEMLLFSS